MTVSASPSREDLALLSTAHPLPPATDLQANEIDAAARIRELLKPGTRIVVTGHERPDGDCIGSEVGLCSILRAEGFSAEVVSADATPEKYRFLDPQNMIRKAAPGEAIAADIVFVLDATDWSRLGPLKKEQFGAAKIVDIDHHLNNPHFGVVNWVDTTAAATAELVFRLASANGWRAPLVSLQALYAGLVTDTGQFSYSNTTARVLRIAAELVALGVSPLTVWKNIYSSKSHAELALESRARASLECVANGRIATISVTQADFDATGTSTQHSEEFVNIPRMLTGVELALFFCEIDGGKRTKISLRSTQAVDASALANKFGGGGHRVASGCSLDGSIAEAKKRFMPVAEQHVAEALDQTRA